MAVKMTATMMAAPVTAAVGLALGAAGTANAVKAEHAFARGTKILGLQANGGVQNNGNTSHPNRGCNAVTGTIGVSFFSH
jgi:hypothetical protein